MTEIDFSKILSVGALLQNYSLVTKKLRNSHVCHLLCASRHQVKLECLNYCKKFHVWLCVFFTKLVCSSELIVFICFPKITIQCMFSKENSLKYFSIIFFCVCGFFGVEYMNIFNIKLRILIMPRELLHILIKSRASLESLLWLS